MKRETSVGLAVTLFVSALAVVISFLQMNNGGRAWGRYGETALMFGGIEIGIGVILVIMPRTKLFGAGVLMGALLTLLIGYSICSGAIRV
jgi:hypothetical protein